MAKIKESILEKSLEVKGIFVRTFRGAPYSYKLFRWLGQKLGAKKRAFKEVLRTHDGMFVLKEIAKENYVFDTQRELTPYQQGKRDLAMTLLLYVYEDDQKTVERLKEMYND